jgi:hypothetical protein
MRETHPDVPSDQSSEPSAPAASWRSRPERPPLRPALSSEPLRRPRSQPQAPDSPELPESPEPGRAATQSSALTTPLRAAQHVEPDQPSALTQPFQPDQPAVPARPGRPDQPSQPGHRAPGPASSSDSSVAGVAGVAADGSLATRPTRGGPATRLTGRGAVVIMFWIFFLGTLMAGWLGLGVLTGLSFVAGCALAARYTKRENLLTVVATPPLVFLIALIIAESLTSHGANARHTIESIAAGIVLTLASVAPWLFTGVIAGLIIAMARGLPGCIRDFAAELRGSAPGGWRPARPGTSPRRPRDD